MAANDERSTRDADLIQELRAIRPRPSEEFRRQLDARAAAGFPPRRRDHSGAKTTDEQPRPQRARTSLRDRFGIPGSWRLGPILAGAAVACAVATAVVVSGPQQLGLGGDSGTDGLTSTSALEAASQTEGPRAGGEASGGSVASENSGATEKQAWSTDAGTDEQYRETLDAAAPATALKRTSGPGAPIASARNRRAVERDASMTLATEPTDVDEVAAGVLRVVDTHSGIVISSTTRGGLEGEAGAEFALKIPSSRLSAALADLSELATVRNRSESSLDITAPTVTVSDKLSEAQARVRGLLKQLANATTDAQRETIEIDLAPAQRRVARLRAQLDRLQRRANFADVNVAIVTGEAGALPEEDEWTLGEAAEDALEVLIVVGGVLLVAAAILVPIGLIALIGWALRRIWLRSARERALRQDAGS